MSIDIETFVVGPLETNCYVVRCAGETWVVDPGLGVEPVIRSLQKRGDSPTRAVLTHGHADHIGGVPAMRAAFPDCRVVCPSGDAEMLIDARANLSADFLGGFTVGEADEAWNPGDVLHCGDSEWRVLDTSGHSAGGVSIHCAAEGVVIVGDALFAGGIGRTDIPGASGSRLLENLRGLLRDLPDETRVLPGHGPETTIGRERRSNPFLNGPTSV